MICGSGGAGGGSSGGNTSRTGLEMNAGATILTTRGGIISSRRASVAGTTAFSAKKQQQQQQQQRLLRGQAAQTNTGERVLLINYVSPTASAATSPTPVVQQQNFSTSNIPTSSYSQAITLTSTTGNLPGSINKLQQQQQQSQQQQQQQPASVSLSTLSSTSRRILQNRAHGTPLSFAGLSSEVTVTLTRSNKQATTSAGATTTTTTAGHIVRNHTTSVGVIDTSLTQNSEKEKRKKGKKYLRNCIYEKGFTSKKIKD